MNIKRATITGTLQDWDLYGDRFDVERVFVDVPIEVLKSFSDEEIRTMIEEECYYSYADGEPLERLLFDGIENGWFKWASRWEYEDPCDLRLEIEED
jgi:hypothetical protein